MKLSTVLILCFFSNFVFSQSLNNFGHIINDEPKEICEIQKIDYEFKISYNKSFYPGNAFIKLSNGFATIESTCGNTPPTLRIFDSSGDLKFLKTYKQTINPETNSSNQFLYFQCNKKTVVINTETFKENTIPTTNDISVNNNGEVVYFLEENNQIKTPENRYSISFIPRSIEINANDDIFVFGKNQFAIIKEGQIHFNIYNKGVFFESKTIDGVVYWVEKEARDEIFNFKLNHHQENEIVTIEKQLFNKENYSKNISHSRGDGDQILCPMYPDSIDYPFRIGNSYAEHQRYGNQPYLHPGVDILGHPLQEIYSPVSGVVKAILTTGGFIYWRLALGLENKPEEQEGYLFAHLDPATIPFAVGDSISAGDFLGVIVEWPTSEFHHLHFARIQHSGETWDGNWLTKDNVLSDITNFKDESNPIFEPLWNDQTIAFRSQNGIEILSSDNLHGSFDIICHAHDLSNDEWRIDVDSIGFEIIDLNTNAVVYAQESFSYNFILDVYEDNATNFEILNTIYSTENLWQSLGNYSTRDFYQQVSRSNGDGVIDDEDSNIYFDSNIIPDGSYLIRVHAFDAVGNHSATEIEVIINNGFTNVTGIENKLPVVYPNPGSGLIKLNPNGHVIADVKIYNSNAQIVNSLSFTEEKELAFHLSNPGLYFVYMFDDNNQLLSREKLVIIR